MTQHIRLIGAPTDVGAGTRGASMGLFKPLVHTGIADKIGLPPTAMALGGVAAG